MPVFDFNNTPDKKQECVCTYTVLHSNEGRHAGEAHAGPG